MASGPRGWVTNDRTKQTRERIRQRLFVSIFGLALGLPACGGGEGARPLVGFGFLGTDGTFATAGYYHLANPRSWFPPCSESKQIGHCYVPNECASPPRPQSPDDAVGADDAVDPGEIVVAGVVLASVGDGLFFADLTPPLPDGIPVAFSVSGSSDVPAHSGEFVIPPPISVIEPDVSQTVDVDRTQPLVVTWTPVEWGEVTAAVRHDVEQHFYVSCSAPAPAGELEIPVEVMKYLPDRFDAADELLTFSVSQSARVEIRPKDWIVSINVNGRGGFSAPADLHQP